VSTHIAFVLGTRPEIIKLAPVIRACNEGDVPYTVIHTGQHYSEKLDSVFFTDLHLPKPDYNLGVGSGTHGEQTGMMLAEIEQILFDEDPDIVLVQGDTNSALAGGIAAMKLDAQLGHVEAGLRSFDRDMPEELNRILVDHGADLLFPPTDDSAARLREEGIPAERVCVTGNTVVDAVLQNRDIAADQSTALLDLDVTAGEFALLTAHRPGNVDDPERFAQLLEGVNRYAELTNTTVLYPVHPRAEAKLEDFDMVVPEHIRCIEPLNFLDFLYLEDTASLVFTDSGGVQEETCILQTPCVTLRENTERPETLDVGSNVLTGPDPESIVINAFEMRTRDTDWDLPFGDGQAAARILQQCNVETPLTSEVRT